MATMIVRHRVANFEQWKAVFDSMERTRLEHGWIGHTVHRDAADPNLVVIVNRIMSIEGAKRYGGSEALRAAMAQGGVQGTPDVQFLEDVA
jgi:quinol monooxygenase YgiN